ncbi:MAG: apolipoprotein N-acyltransferase [Gammaproteobacteria bacterium]|nr:apolipoprotein N-acyltransferase [Gammaproteobacteria bacterium]
MRNVLLALGAGGLLPFAFAPYGFHPLAMFSLAGLFWLWRHASPTYAAVLAGGFGVGMFAHGVSWVQISIHQFGLPLYSFSVSMTVLFIAILSCFPMVAGYWVQRLPARSEALRLLVLMPGIWVVTEVLRSWLFTGFPWLLVGYSQTGSWLAGYAPVLGVYGVTWVVALIAALLVLILEFHSLRRSLVAIAMVVALIGGGYGLGLVQWTRPIFQAIDVALIQGAVPQAIKWQTEFRQRTLALYEDLSKAQWGKAIVVWPETAIPAFPDEIPEALAQFGVEARSSNTALLAGIPTGDRRGGAYFNSVVLLNDPKIRYDKHHLVPFGEYLPFDRWIRPVLNFLAIPMSNFAPGAPEQVPLEYGELRIGVSICYEDAYAHEVANALPEANILVNVSDDAWFGDSIAPHQHLQIAQMRALETGRTLLRATNTGISAIIDHQGQVSARSPQFESFVLTGRVELREGATPFINGGGNALWGFIALGIALGCRLRLYVKRAAR